MSVTSLHKKVSQKIKLLSDQQLREVLLFIEFLNTRENEEFINCVNSQTRQAMDDRKKGAKFYSLEELQKEFSGS